MHSCRTLGLNPTSEFPYCIETSFKRFLVLLLSDANIAEGVQHNLGVKMALVLPDRALKGVAACDIQRSPYACISHLFFFSCTVSSNTCFAISFTGMVENWDCITVAALPQNLMDEHCLNGK